MTARPVIHISGPMSNVLDRNEGAFRDTEERLRKMGYDRILNPINIDPDTPYREAMQINCEWITEQATAMVVLRPIPDKVSLGSQAEQHLAIACDIPVYYLCEDGEFWTIVANGEPVKLPHREVGDG